MPAVTLEMIQEAHELIKSEITYTPVYNYSRLGENLFIKMENLQKTGSFKIRGAINKIQSLSQEELDKGLVTVSAGNHAQAVALSATRSGSKAHICMPEGASLAKISATEQYGGEVILVPGNFDTARDRSYLLRDEFDYTYVHPYDDPLIIAGQGTIGLELLEQIPGLTHVVVPIGGGGLISGIAIAIKSLHPEIKIIGVEPAEAASMTDSLEVDKPITLEQMDTIADGTAVGRPGDLNFDIAKEYIDDIVTVSEAEITNTVLRLLEEGKVTTEGAGSLAVAAVLHDKYDFGEDAVIGAVLSGGNINVNLISRIIDQGLYASGRLIDLRIPVRDRPGELMKLLSALDHHHVNILSIQQLPQEAFANHKTKIVRLSLETSGFEQIASIKHELTGLGYEFLA